MCTIRTRLACLYSNVVEPDSITPLQEDCDQEDEIVRQGDTDVKADDEGGLPPEDPCFPLIDYHSTSNHRRSWSETSLSDIAPTIDDGTFNDYTYSSYPCHLFDTERGRNITRVELKDDISAALGRWLAMPLTCSDILESISNTLSPSVPSQYKHKPPKQPLCWPLHPYIAAAMMKTPLVDGKAPFLSTLREELQAAQRGMPCQLLPIDTILRTVHNLIDSVPIRDGKAVLLPASSKIAEHAALLRQYAVLSHRWDQDSGQELTFDDMANLAQPHVRAKRGFAKFEGFRRVVRSTYGCRYIWMDSACISEPDRNTSIPQMFDWYSHAYVCVIHLTAPTVASIAEDPWCTRGWTLQEFLAARNIKCVQRDWTFIDPSCKFDASCSAAKSSRVFGALKLGTGLTAWGLYKPNVDEALLLFLAMRNRVTTIPEDMVYCLFAPLSIYSLPVEYGEGFDSAFYRLQVECVSRSSWDRRLLLWDGTPSPHHSMLAGSFQMFSLGFRVSPNIGHIVEGLQMR
ncbi:hypothetical protein CCMSSC00406_0008268 [Pleurotus cornucopiae]|uniref:Uncharacterized protein n=1 Tax=Pleurotus cornucopiae TaxID=5321 RepID=A0ACB7JCD2_PLECO|nr:hypothetical protein CCMSSC00406_0008268 [Pleurotus cornucopiae]